MFCNRCSYCDQGESCQFCNLSQKITFCKNSNFLNNCDFLENCNFCVNICNSSDCYFCYSENKDENKNGKFKVFNVQLTEEEYKKIKKIDVSSTLCYNRSLDFKENFRNLWTILTDVQKKYIISLPGFNKDDFFKFYGVEI